ncbi:hypothetical protein D3C80_1772080 [compost metagenome]
MAVRSSASRCALYCAATFASLPALASAALRLVWYCFSSAAVMSRLPAPGYGSSWSHRLDQSCCHMLPIRCAAIRPLPTSALSLP